MTTRGLLEQVGCAQVAMEATCVYRTPVWHILEEAVQQMPANAAPIKGVSGRKSDAGWSIKSALGRTEAIVGHRRLAGLKRSRNRCPRRWQKKCHGRPLQHLGSSVRTPNREDNPKATKECDEVAK